ncbi:beta-ketoacyl synthase N-terminal-like domain-containing protein [Streptomyces diastatochromogenes]|nr:beta-ketoacyl synthase N-terminal-like domain-containing protein [Streptomyces diastatochromogenes]
MSLTLAGSAPASPDDGAVAVVGMACRLPGARDVRAFRALLRAAGTASAARPRGAAPVRGRSRYAGRENFVPAMGVIEDSRRFDWSFFRYSRAEAAAMDPQQRVFLECAATAVDDAGLDPVRFPGRIGVYAGADRSGPGAPTTGWANWRGTSGGRRTSSPPGWPTSSACAGPPSPCRPPAPPRSPPSTSRCGRWWAASATRPSRAASP